MPFPSTRMRRLRYSAGIRDMVRETSLSPDNFILPLFIRYGKGIKKEVTSMPGVFQMSVDIAVSECESILKDGVKAIILFGIPDEKNETGSEAYSENGIIPQAIRAIKNKTPEMTIITDVCLCEYTSHGHCGIIKNNDVDNDLTINLLALESIAHVRAGADMVAPSDMMDGRVGHIRKALDSSGFETTPIMAYSAKYASAFYGPFREAAESAPKFGDRKTYQMDPANRREAMREIALDIEEGADIVMVKPAMPCLDIIREAKDTFGLPLAAYQVSGEYAMIKAAVSKGWLDHERTMMESLLSIKRAGADIIITYFAREAAGLLK